MSAPGVPGASTTADVEAQLIRVVETAVPEMEMGSGALSRPKSEGTERFGVVAIASSANRRLPRGVDELTESYALTLFWSETLGRAVALQEWNLIELELRSEQYLYGIIPSLWDTWVASYTWGDTADGKFVTISAIVNALRYA